MGTALLALCTLASGVNAQNNDAELSALALVDERGNDVPLDPPFDSVIVSTDPSANYKAYLANAIDYVTVTATARDGDAGIALPDDADPNTPGTQVPVNVGHNPITVTVTATDGVTSTSKVVDVIRDLAPIDGDAVWSSEVTVREDPGTGIFGGGLPRLESMSHWAFRYGNRNHYVVGVSYATEDSAIGPEPVIFSVSPGLGQGSLRDNLILEVGGRSFQFKQAHYRLLTEEHDWHSYAWPNSALGWADGDRVTVKLKTVPPPPPPPPPPPGGGGGGGSANRPPVIEAEIEPQTVDAGEALELDIRLNFYDRDQRALDYTVESADPEIAEVEVDRNGVLTIRGVRRGVTAITVTAADRRDERVSQTFLVRIAGPALVAFFPSASDEVREGFLRVINHAEQAGEVSIEAIDDRGMRTSEVTLSFDGNETVHFNSDDLEDGNAAKGLSGGVGPGEGDWRLVLGSDLDFEVLAYIRTEDGFLTAMHDTVPMRDRTYRVATFNPGSNVSQMSRLRLVNPGGETAEITVQGLDDAGASPGSAVAFDIPGGHSVTLTASELESGAGVAGALGDGKGKWRLSVTSDRPIVAMSLLSSPTGHLTNLSALPPTPDEDGGHVVPLFPTASDPLGRQGFVRVVNRADESGTVLIEAYDDSDLTYPTVTLALDAKQTRHFNSDDLELGNANKGLTGSTGTGMGDWRLVLSSDLDIDVLAYIRTEDGFLTSMHDVAPELLGERRVAIFNPGSNPNQLSRLRLVNPGTEDAEVTITGVDDDGASPGGVVTVTVPAGASRTIDAADLEAGAEGFEGALGDGVGKWRLAVTSEQPVIVMSLLSSPTGHLTNLSTAPDRGGT